MLRIMLLLLVALLVGDLSAQSLAELPDVLTLEESDAVTDAAPDSESTFYRPQTALRAAYLGALIYPGFRLGIERPFKSTQVTKVRSRKVKTRYRIRYLAYSFGMYHQPDFHNNFMLNAEYLARRQRSGGFYTESNFGLGMSRTFLTSPAFEVLEDGTVQQRSLAGNWFAMGTVGLTMGYNNALLHKKPYAFYMKHQWLLMFPHNGFILPRPTLELGFQYQLENFWKASPRLREKSKRSWSVRRAEKQDL